MRFASLGSGSEGNCLIVEVGPTRVLIDCGFRVRDTVARMPIGSQSPTMENPGVSPGTARYTVSRTLRSGRFSVHRTP